MQKIRNFENGKMVTSGRQFLTGSDAVAEGCAARLQLLKGEYMPDGREGLPAFEEILGFQPAQIMEAAIRSRISTSTGVTAILSYSQTNVDRKLMVECTIEDIYGGVKEVTYG